MSFIINSDIPSEAENIKNIETCSLKINEVITLENVRVFERKMFKVNLF